MMIDEDRNWLRCFISHNNKGTDVSDDVVVRLSCINFRARSNFLDFTTQLPSCSCACPAPPSGIRYPWRRRLLLPAPQASPQSRRQFSSSRTATAHFAGLAWTCRCRSPTRSSRGCVGPLDHEWAQLQAPPSAGLRASRVTSSRSAAPYTTTPRCWPCQGEVPSRRPEASLAGSARLRLLC